MDEATKIAYDLSRDQPYWFVEMKRTDRGTARSYVKFGTIDKTILISWSEEPSLRIDIGIQHETEGVLDEIPCVNWSDTLSHAKELLR